ncbi:DUF4268 domain-containing protein [Herpetosiphon gulosus]|uniref:CBS domain-containing protein n=1 Tax=Herpetosiphon gulosus TaxID=1973496 RepID=A0ABP9X9D0_9CHLR
MRFSVQQLLNDRPMPLAVRSGDALITAIDLMTEHEYSQLPVVDAAGKPEGLVCSDSIVQALRHFPVAAQSLRVSDAMVKAVIKRDDQELFDLLDDLQNTYALLIVNTEGTLTGIVTSYDTTEYFRRQTQDLLFIQDVELMLRDFVQAPFIQPNGELDSEAFQDHIQRVLGAGPQMAQFAKAVRWLTDTTNAPRVENRFLSEAFETHFQQRTTAKTYADLTLYETIQLFVSPKHWEHYGELFSFQPEHIQGFFDAVRQTRNDLAHLREISDAQRTQVRFFKDWLTRYHSKLTAPIVPPPAEGDAPLTPVMSEVIIAPTEPAINELPSPFEPIEDAPQPRSSRYDRLAQWLRSQPRKTDRVPLSFEQIEQIIESPLPESARKHRAWWANDSHAHVQSISWLAADWKVSYINMDQEMVTFSRIHEREQAYIDFFSRFVAELGARDKRFLPMSPNGTSWITVARIKAQQRSIAVLNAQFTRTSFFRLELYIDTENEALNTAMYEALWQLYLPKMAKLTARIGTAPEWDAMPGRRAARVTVSHPGSITANKEKLAKIRQWGVETMVVFHQLFADAGQLLEQHYTNGAAPDLAALFS